MRPNGSLDNVAPALVTTEDSEVRIFPNPVAGDQLRLQYPVTVEGTVVFRCFDALGRRVLTAAFSVPVGLNVLDIMVPTLRPGLYVLRWEDAQGRTGNQKFIRQ